MERLDGLWFMLSAKIWQVYTEDGKGKDYVKNPAAYG